MLVDNFNPATIPETMCRSLVSVSWDGKLHACTVKVPSSAVPDPRLRRARMAALAGSALPGGGTGPLHPHTTLLTLLTQLTLLTPLTPLTLLALLIPLHLPCRYDCDFDY
mgnify:CR=1 FL=1